MTNPFVLGVNYWPRTAAMYWWKRFAETEDEVIADFKTMREMGLTVARIFLLWEDFQPEANIIAEKQIVNLVKVCDWAAEAGIGLDVTFFVGHMSGPNWCPKWMVVDGPMPDGVFQVISKGEVVDRAYRNFFSDPFVQSAQCNLIRAVVERLASHPAVVMWNLGNEPDLFAVPPTPLHGQQWVRRMTTLIHAIDSALQRPVTCGLHAPSLLRSPAAVTLPVHAVFRNCDLPVIHGYAMFHPEVARGPLDPLFVPFLCALTTALCLSSAADPADADIAGEMQDDVPARPDADWATLAEEFGGCMLPNSEAVEADTWVFRTFLETERRQYMATQRDFAAHLSLLLNALQRTGARGAMLWCWADYARELYDRPPCNMQQHERHFGLIDADGQPKPYIAQVIRSFAEQNPQREMNSGRWCGHVRLPCSAKEYYYGMSDAERLECVKRMYAQFCADMAEGEKTPA